MHQWCPCREGAGGINAASLFSCSLVSWCLLWTKHSRRLRTRELFIWNPYWSAPGAPSKMRKYREDRSSHDSFVEEFKIPKSFFMLAWNVELDAPVSWIQSSLTASMGVWKQLLSTVEVGRKSVFIVKKHVTGQSI